MMSFGLEVTNMNGEKLTPRDIAWPKSTARFGKTAGGVAIRVMAEEIREEIQNNAFMGNVKPDNSPWTTAIKGLSYPVVDHGKLIKSIVVRQAGPLTCVVGWRPQDYHHYKYGTKIQMARLGQLQSSGYDITITPKMMRFFKVMAGKYGVRPPGAVGNTLHVPARDFMSVGGRNIPFKAELVSGAVAKASGKILGESCLRGKGKGPRGGKGRRAGRTASTAGVGFTPMGSMGSEWDLLLVGAVTQILSRF